MRWAALLATAQEGERCGAALPKQANQKKRGDSHPSTAAAARSIDRGRWRRQDDASLLPRVLGPLLRLVLDIPLINVGLVARVPRTPHTPSLWNGKGHGATRPGTSNSTAHAHRVRSHISTRYGPHTAVARVPLSSPSRFPMHRHQSGDRKPATPESAVVRQRHTRGAHPQRTPRASALARRISLVADTFFVNALAAAAPDMVACGIGGRKVGSGGSRTGVL